MGAMTDDAPDTATKAGSTRGSASFDLMSYEFPAIASPSATREPTAAGRAEKSVGDKPNATAMMMIGSAVRDKAEPRKPVDTIAETAQLIEEGYATALKRSAEFNRVMMELAVINTLAAAEFAQKLLSVKSVSQLVELSVAHTYKQLDVISAEVKELAEKAEKGRDAHIVLASRRLSK
jgi:hypothetical protein